MRCTRPIACGPDRTSTPALQTAIVDGRPLGGAGRVGQPVVEVGRGLEDASREAGRLLLIPIPGESPRNEGVVVRPDSADMVADGIVATLGRRHGAYAPAREERIAHQMAHTGFGLVLVGDAAP